MHDTIHNREKLARSWNEVDSPTPDRWDLHYIVSTFQGKHEVISWQTGYWISFRKRPCIITSSISIMSNEAQSVWHGAVRRCSAHSICPASRPLLYKWRSRWQPWFWMSFNDMNWCRQQEFLVCLNRSRCVRPMGYLWQSCTCIRSTIVYQSSIW